MNETRNHPPLLELRDVYKVFYTDDTQTNALQGIDFQVRRGEFVSITGPSGCGKSTLMSILGTLDVASSGSYLLNGVEVESLDAIERARIRSREIGFVFQAFNLIGDLSVLENVVAPLIYRRDIQRRERKMRAIESLARVGMTHRANHYPSQLSGGQQQRVAIARALVGAPSILLADEPTGNLDSKSGESVIRLLQDLNDLGSTVCMVTHDPRYSAVADRELFIFDGRIVESAEAAGMDHWVRARR